MGYASASILGRAAERCLYRIDHRVQPRVSNLVQTVRRREKYAHRPRSHLEASCVIERDEVCRSAKGPDARMSGDTFLAIIAVSLTAIFISVFAIECDRVWQRYRESRRRKMEEQTWLSRRQN